MASIPIPSFLAGFWVGVAVAAPIGPMGMLCIQRTLAYGMVAGLGTGFAAATVQVSYGTLALLGLSPVVLAFVGASANVLSAASGAILLWFAIRTARGAPTIRADMATTSPGIGRSFRDGLALGFSNPMAVALFFAASPALGRAGSSMSAFAVVLGIFAGAIGWYASLSGIVTVGRGWLLTQDLALTRRLSTALLVVFATYMFSNAFWARA
jgi:threonine/homoserine/homoserine lactone efflux protein